MKTSRLKIADLIATRTLKSGNSKRLSQEIAAYLLENRRVNELNSIVRDVQIKWAEAGLVEVVAETAHTIDAATKKQIEAEVKLIYPDAKKITINEVHNASILSGVRLNLADKQLDLSALSKLNKFRQLTASGKE